MVSESNGADRANVDDLGRDPILLGEASRGLEAHVKHHPVAHDREVGAPLHIRAPDGNLEAAVGNVALHGPVGFLVLEEEHGIGVANRRAKHPGRVGGVDGTTTLRPGT